MSAVVVFRNGTEELVTPEELRVLHRCGLVNSWAVNDRWHTDYERDGVFGEVLENVRQQAVTR